MDHNNFETDVVDRLARIETRLEAMLDLPPRVDLLERFQSKILGAVAVISALIGMAAEHLFYHKGLI